MKITINNEEVLSNKDFTINEEMLNTSSVILDNVYPRTWEADKDYVSRFYYPKDYSKCKIFNEVYHPEQKSTASGTSISINNVDTDKGSSYTAKGQTTQSGTPTPSSPVAVNTTTGRQEVYVGNRNWFDNSKSYTYQTANYFLETTISTGKRISWTSSSSLTYQFLCYAVMDLTNFVGKTIRFRTDFTASGNNTGQYYIGLCNADGSNRTAKENTIVSGHTVSFVVPQLNGQQKYLCVVLYVNGNGTLTQNDYVDYTNMMLTIDDNDMTYETYNGTTKEINLGKNILNTLINRSAGYTTEKNGITEVYNDDGSITLSGIANAQTDLYITNAGYNTTNNTFILDYNSSYTLSLVGNTNTNIQILIGYGSSAKNTSTSRTDTYTTNISWAFIRIANGTNLTTPITIYPQLEKGSSASSFSPYKTPIYLGKIGTYQDYIIKTSGKNLFDKDSQNIENAFLNWRDGTTTANSTYRVSDYIDVSDFNYITVSGNGGNSENNCFYDESKNFVSYFGMGTNASKTAQVPSNAKYLRCTVNMNNLSQYQVEAGNQISKYEPFGEGQWYIHKEIGRYVYNNDLTNNSITADKVEMLTPALDIVANKRPLTDIAICNMMGSSLVNYTGLDGTTSAKKIRVNMSTSYANSYNDFKTLASNNNLTIYYVLATPTTTLIEDEELINELESVKLISGLNNISISSPDLPFNMNLVYNYQEAYTEEEMLFCGVVENTGNISLNPRYPHYCSLQVLDFKTFLSEGETLDFVIYEKTVEEAIEQIISVIAPYGFIKGNINILNGSDVIGAYSTKDKTAYDVFNYIADITQSRWTTRMIDEDTVAIDFYDPSLMPQGTAIEYTKIWFCNNNILDMSFSYSSRDYRNKQVMLSGEVYANIETIEVITADGYQTQFNTTDKIGYVSSIKINGNPATIITKEEYDLGYEGDFIYQPGNPYFESVDLVSTGAIITIVYYAVIEGREVLLNQTEIERINTSINRKGVVARYETRNDATTTQELNQIGQSYLKYKGSPEVLLKVETLNNIWNIGERVSFTAPLTELTTEYMVKKKSVNYITTQDKVFYSYELTSNFNSETEINYFDNQRAKTMGNIGVGEYISRNVDIENTANIVFYDLEVNETTITGDSALQSTLQTPLGVE